MPAKKLLVADDSLTIQKVIRLALSNEGYEIQAVSDGNDAIQQISLFRPDLVLIDVSLPGKSAFEVKKEINAHSEFEEIRFVLMSSAFENVDERTAEEVQFHGRLVKPFDPAHLRQILVDVLGQVTAKRMEKTSILTLDSLQASLTPPPITPDMSSEDSSSQLPPPPPSSDAFAEANENWNIPIVPEELPTLPPLDQTPPVLTNNSWEPTAQVSSPMPELPPLPEDLPPPPAFAMPELPDIGPDSDIKELTNTTLRNAGMDDFQWSVQEPTPIQPPPPPAAIQAPKLPPQQRQPVVATPPPIIPTSEPDQAHLQHAIRTDDLETIVAKQLEQTLEKFTRSLLPDLAEKIIKQEIHRLLSE